MGNCRGRFGVLKFDISLRNEGEDCEYGEGNGCSLPSILNVVVESVICRERGFYWWLCVGEKEKWEGERRDVLFEFEM